MRVRRGSCVLLVWVLGVACGGGEGVPPETTEPGSPTETASEPAPSPTPSPSVVDLEALDLSDLFGLAVDGEGRVYVPDGYPAVIHRLDPASGTATVAAADVSVPNGLAVGPDGNLYFAEPEFHRIRMVALTSGIITTVAGTGSEVFAGDGGPATEAGMRFPLGVALDGQGNLFIAEFNRIRRVDAATGIITTVAGNGREGYNGDGIPAVEARLTAPHGVVVDAQGTLWIPDSYGYRIRRVDPATGEIETVVGTGEQGYSGDGGPGTEAMISVVRRPAFGPDGRLYLDDCDNHRIRALDVETGIVETVVGTGESGFGGDGGPALEARIGCPDAIGFAPDGTMYFADIDWDVVRAVAPDGTITTLVG